MRPLPEPEKPEKQKADRVMTKDRKLMELYKERSKNLTVAVVALCLVIGALFLIRMFGTASPYTDYKQKVLDEYAGWKEELTQKEEQLHLWEESLTKWEQDLLRREEELQ